MNSEVEFECGVQQAITGLDTNNLQHQPKYLNTRNNLFLYYKYYPFFSEICTWLAQTQLLLAPGYRTVHSVEPWVVVWEDDDGGRGKCSLVCVHLFTAAAAALLEPGYHHRRCMFALILLMVSEMKARKWRINLALRPFITGGGRGLSHGVILHLIM